MSNKGVGTDNDSFDMVKVRILIHLFIISNLTFPFWFQHLEDVILFKNQELSEFTAELKARDEKISMIENIWFRSRENIPKQVRNSFTS